MLMSSFPFISWFVALFFFNPSFERPPVQSEGALLFYVDTASFRGAEGKTRQEFYCQIPLAQLAFEAANRAQSCELKIAAALKDSTGRQLLHDEWTQTVQAHSAAEIAGNFFPCQFDLSLLPGRYELALTLTEMPTHKTGMAVLPFHAARWSGTALQLSEIQFSSSINSDTASSRFNKNGVNVTPYASRLFGGGLPLLYFYYEIYNAAADSYQVHYAVRDQNQKVVRELPPKIVHPSQDRSLEVGALHPGNLAEPSYQMKITIKERATGTTATATKNFFMLAPAAAVVAEAEQRLAAMTEPELQTHLEHIQYLLHEDDRQMLAELEPTAQRSYLAQLWRGWDPRPETPANEFWQDYFQRLAYANVNFSAGFTTGWKTDRGRIALKFGVPGEVERFPAETNARPYEVWYYYREGRKKFIFADLEGQGRYELIFSSDERELTRPDWRLIIGAR